MELPDRLAESCKQLRNCWSMIYRNDYSREQNRHGLYWLKQINIAIENLESKILGLEKALRGNKMPADRQMELDVTEESEAMINRWLPIIILGEMNREE